MSDQPPWDPWQQQSQQYPPQQLYGQPPYPQGQPRVRLGEHAPLHSHQHLEAGLQLSCEAFGQSGNFQVFEDGGSDFNGVSVNDLAMSKSASTWAYNDGGTHYLQINSECTWKVKVLDEP